MSRKFKCSRAAIVAAGVAFLGLLLTLCLHLSILRAIGLHRIHNRAVEDAVLAEITAKECFDEENRRALEAEVRRFRGSLGDFEAWSCLSAKFGKEWSRDVGTKDEHGEYVMQIYTLRKESPKAAEWPAILQAVKGAELIQGVSIAEFKMTVSEGPEPHPADFVSIGVEVRSRKRSMSTALQ